ncbi:hypothetical protein QLQ12_28900 [Actinoplanes sp. NEAU-A12]|uniref:IrrE N-terminal-like domain-containing protein n=1 Tax=Actinoplanes sandaracinus TaxID=3045177 RepID=A0ABT6WSE0_9ACTN|nr:hypothetical protein [Actinoplanes sandaracinus]
MVNRQLRRRCEQAIADLDVPQPIDIHKLCQVLSERNGRPIHLLPMKLPVNSPCGMWVRTTAFDAVFYEAETSVLHQLQIIGHELGHLIGGHQASEVLDAQASRLLLPDLDPALVRRFLGRSNYSRDEEREAEMIGSLLVKQADLSTAPAPADTPPELTDIMNRLQHSLAHHRRSPHG